MDRNELITIDDLEESYKKLKYLLLTEFGALKKQIEEQNKPYIYWCENMSMKQAMEYTGKSKSTILTWVRDELLTPYTIGSSTNVYYSKAELDSLKARWESQKRNKALKKAV